MMDEKAVKEKIAEYEKLLQDHRTAINQLTAQLQNHQQQDIMVQGAIQSLKDVLNPPEPEKPKPASKKPRSSPAAKK